MINIYICTIHIDYKHGNPRPDLQPWPWQREYENWDGVRRERFLTYKYISESIYRYNYIIYSYIMVDKDKKKDRLIER